MSDRGVRVAVLIRIQSVVHEGGGISPIPMMKDQTHNKNNGNMIKSPYRTRTIMAELYKFFVNKLHAAETRSF